MSWVSPQVWMDGFGRKEKGEGRKRKGGGGRSVVVRWRPSEEEGHRSLKSIDFRSGHFRNFTDFALSRFGWKRAWEKSWYASSLLLPSTSLPLDLLICLHPPANQTRSSSDAFSLWQHPCVLTGLYSAGFCVFSVLGLHFLWSTTSLFSQQPLFSRPLCLRLLSDAFSTLFDICFWCSPTSLLPRWILSSPVPFCSLALTVVPRDICW
ncbi:hypothetical protein BDY24DRAFT_388043 [Mrakia frigida]|uniref:uncharacterized protein n=1 Tax=Mrakia frigida TaxID=29902 RepID=UPI003FCBFEF5